MATPFNSYFFSSGVIASQEVVWLRIFSNNCVVVKTKEMPVKKITFLLRPNFSDFIASKIFCRKYIAAF